MRALLRLVVIVLMVAVWLIVGSTAAFADTETYVGSVSFISDAQPPQNINLPSFNTMGGTRTLQTVSVEIFHSGSVDLAADNDDAFNVGRVQGRMIRWWSGTGPGVNTGTITRTATTSAVDLGLDNGDGAVVDPTAPDGTDFGGPVSFPTTLANSYNPATALYTTSGPGTVSFTITPELMINDLQWLVTPDVWQLQVQNADMTITVRLNYEYQQQGTGGPGAGAVGVPPFPNIYIGIGVVIGVGLIAYPLRRRLVGSAKVD